MVVLGPWPVVGSARSNSLARIPAYEERAVAVGQVGPADGAGEEDVAAEHEGGLGVEADEDDRAGAVAGDLADLEVEPAELEPLAVVDEPVGLGADHGIPNGPLRLASGSVRSGASFRPMISGSLREDLLHRRVAGDVVDVAVRVQDRRRGLSPRGRGASRIASGSKPGSTTSASPPGRQSDVRRSGRTGPTRSLRSDNPSRPFGGPPTRRRTLHPDDPAHGDVARRDHGTGAWQPARGHLMAEVGRLGRRNPINRFGAIRRSKRVGPIVEMTPTVGDEAVAPRRDRPPGPGKSKTPGQRL